MVTVDGFASLETAKWVFATMPKITRYIAPSHMLPGIPIKDMCIS